MTSLDLCCPGCGSFHLSKKRLATWGNHHHHHVHCIFEHLTKWVNIHAPWRMQKEFLVHFNIFVQFVLLHTNFLLMSWEVQTLVYFGIYKLILIKSLISQCFRSLIGATLLNRLTMNGESICHASYWPLLRASSILGTKELTQRQPITLCVLDIG